MEAPYASQKSHPDLRDPCAQLLTCGHGCKLRGLVLHIRHATDHVESSLWDVVAGPRQHLLEITDSRLKVDKCTSCAREDLRNEERLRKETLDFAGAGHRQLVLLAK